MPSHITAKLGRLKRGDYKVTCGADGCPAVLGIARSKTVGTALTPVDITAWAAREASGDPVRGAWTLTADPPYGGYYRNVTDPPATYRLVRPDRVRGRRPLPPGLASGAEELNRSRRIIGQFPSLPAAVVCPQCGRANIVTVPPRD